MNIGLICTFAGPVISFLVAALKKVSFVANYPKTVAALLSGVVAVATSIWGDSTTGIAQIIACFLVPFAGAITTHEVVTKQVEKVANAG